MKCSAAEKRRLQKMLANEQRLQGEGFLRIAGIDEAGRGPLAGPVVAAACILPEQLLFPNLNDSKQLRAKDREALFQQLIPYAVCGIGVAEVEEIDRYNILQATFLAMHRALAAMPIQPDSILVDGNQKPLFPIYAETIVAGDAKSASIAAASVLAKVTRDRIMETLDLQWPEYGFKQHKGYATEQHVAAILKFGPCPVHRKSFDPVRSMLSTQGDFLS